MARLLGKIRDPQNDTSVFNKNFDNIALDLADKNGRFSGTGTVSGLVVPAGGFKIIEVNVVDGLNQYVVNSMPVLPRLDVFVDNDQDGAYYYPGGSALNASLIGLISVETTIARTVFNQVTNEKATWFCVIRNNDASPHTFYIYVQGFYLPSPTLGIATRTI